MDGAEIFLISVIGLLLIYLGKKLEKTTKSSAGNEQDVRSNAARQRLLSDIPRHIEIISESLQIAKQSHNPETKISRLGIAKQKLDMLTTNRDNLSLNERVQLNQFHETVSELELEFLTDHIQEVSSLIGLGERFEKEGKPDEAIMEYESAISLVPETHFAYKRLAILYAKKRQLENELRVLEAALRNVPPENAVHYQWFSDRLAKKLKS